MKEDGWKVRYKKISFMATRYIKTFPEERVTIVQKKGREDCDVFVGSWSVPFTFRSVALAKEFADAGFGGKKND